MWYKYCISFLTRWGSTNHSFWGCDMDNTVSIRGSLKDIAKLDALFRMMFPDIKIIPKPLHIKLPPRDKQDGTRGIKSKRAACAHGP